MGLLIAALDEIFRLEALAHEAALHVDLAGEHGVDAPLGDIGLQLFEDV